MTYKMQIFTLLLGVIIVCLIGLRSIEVHTLFKNISCGDIARYHQDYLMQHYGVTAGFNTNQDNPNSRINQRAADLNSKLLEICLSDPR